MVRLHESLRSRLTDTQPLPDVRAGALSCLGAGMHYHAYTWRGQTSQLEAETPRLISDWFRRKPAATWDDPEPAVAWLRKGYGEIAESIRHSYPPSWMTLDEELDHARHDLNHGQEVIWTYYLGGITAGLYVIACPDRWGKVPCPTGR